eukprot:277998-Pelagomonas_calceolata.AAC.1
MERSRLAYSLYSVPLTAISLCNSSRPDAILVTPHLTNPNRPPTPTPNRVLRSVGSSTTPARHIHLIGIKYCKDTRPSAQLEASQQQH